MKNYEELGWQFRKEKQFEKAIEAFDKGIKLDQKVYFAKHGKGECLIELGRYDEAIDCFKEAVKIDSNHNWAYYGLGKAFFFKQNYETAKEFFDKSIRRNNQSVSALLWKGKTLIKLHKYDEALDSFHTSLRYAAKYRYDMLEEIETEINNITEYKDKLEKENELLKTENQKLKEELQKKGVVIINGDFVEKGTIIKDDAVVNRSNLNLNKEERYD
ncbi:MAG: tetratricopeptide repeat protein [Methanocorpusculum sp.]|nr:tetratricopeptide repeat protein [Methanocorpusculum sp.]